MIQVYINDEYIVNSWLKEKGETIEVISGSFTIDDVGTSIVMIVYRVK